MSISTSGMIGSAPVDYGLAGVLGNDAEISKKLVTTLTQQTADGLVSDSYSGLGANAKVALDLSPSIAHENTWASNITAADGTIGVTQSAFSEITSIATNFYTQLQTMDADGSGQQPVGRHGRGGGAAGAAAGRPRCSTPRTGMSTSSPGRTAPIRQCQVRTTS